MGRPVCTIAAVAVLGLLAAPPSSADPPKPKTGKWKGRLTQIFTPPSPGAEPLDFGRELTFRVKRGKARKSRIIRNFDTQVVFRPFDYCGRLGTRLTVSRTRAAATRRRYRFFHQYRDLTFFPVGRFEYSEHVEGRFTSRSKAKGNLDVDLFTSAHEPSADCTSGTVRWKAHRVRSGA